MTLQEMARIHYACFAGHRAWPANELAEILQNPHCFALTRAGGFLIGQAVAGEAEILTLAVDPTARRQGIGRALVDAFLNTARQKGAEQGFLEVEADNHAAVALYISCGFAQTGLRRAYYQRADGLRSDALILSCPLSQRPKVF